MGRRSEGGVEGEKENGGVKEGINQESNNGTVQYWQCTVPYYNTGTVDEKTNGRKMEGTREQKLH